MIKKLDRVTGPDGRDRTAAAEHHLNEAVAATFRGRSGEVVMDYLRAITINFVAGPEVSDSFLRHMEGQRFLCGLIQTRIVNGGKQRKRDISKKDSE